MERPYNLIWIYYQNLTYNNEIINKVTTIIAIIPGCNLNMDLSSTNAFGFIFGPPKLMRIIISIVKKNASPMQIWKGIS